MSIFSFFSPETLETSGRRVGEGDGPEALDSFFGENMGDGQPAGKKRIITNGRWAAVLASKLKGSHPPRK